VSDNPHWRGRLVGAAAVILEPDGRVLLVRHTYGRFNWDLPGGASDPGESVVETALRETREETGLEVVAERMTGIYYRTENDSHHFVFRCRVDGDRVPRPSSDEISDCAYWPLDELPRPISDFTVRRVTEAVRDGPMPVLPAEHPTLTWLE
jgi:8-oxo-dGTP diphosphatase